MQNPTESPSPSPSQLISAKIVELGDWRGVTLSRMRQLIQAAVPDVVEEWKWKGTPVWSHNGILCTGESYKNVVKLTFAKGASLPDPARLFNASLEGNVRRAIDLHEGEQIDDSAFKALIRAAVARNSTAPTPPIRTDSGPRSQSAYGGIENVTSSRSSEANSSTSYRSKAVKYRSNICR